MANATNKAYETIRARILDGNYPPGMHLREKEIADEIGVSRTPAREAMRKLAADGYVEYTPNKGAFVAQWSQRSLSDLIDVRAELAALAGRLAASHVRKPQLEELTRLNRAMAELAQQRPPGYLTDVSALNLEFHNTIFKASENEWLLNLLQQTAFLPMVQRAQYAYQPTDWQRGFERYTELISALASGDGAWASSILRSHFLASKHALLKAKSVKGEAAETLDKPLD